MGTIRCTQLHAMLLGHSDWVRKHVNAGEYELQPDSGRDRGVEDWRTPGLEDSREVSGEPKTRNKML